MAILPITFWEQIFFFHKVAADIWSNTNLTFAKHVHGETCDPPD
jgi:hypothetical protein